MAKAMIMMARIVRMTNPIISSPPIVLALALKSDVVGCFVDWGTLVRGDAKKKLLINIKSVNYLVFKNIFILQGNYFIVIG